MKTLFNPKLIILEKHAVWVELVVQRKIQYTGLALMVSIVQHMLPLFFESEVKYKPPLRKDWKI